MSRYGFQEHVPLRIPEHEPLRIAQAARLPTGAAVTAQGMLCRSAACRTVRRWQTSVRAATVADDGGTMDDGTRWNGP